MLGAPWIRAGELAAELSPRKIPGVRFAAAEFTPAEGIYSGQACQGVTITIVDGDSLRSMLVGIEIADALHRLYPGRFQLTKIIELLGSQATLDRLERGEAPAEIVAGWTPDLDKFRKVREKYLLYH